MSYSKRQFIQAALEEIGMAPNLFDIETDQYESAMRRMDSMVAGWNVGQTKIGYPIPSSPENSDLDQETNVPDAANEAIILNLAVAIAPSYGKTVSPDTKTGAKKALRNLRTHCFEPIEMQLGESVPLGAGNKPWRKDNSNGIRSTTPEGITIRNDGDLELF